ncbi:MAG: caspase family protein [Chloroflexia bacterium]|nr:caspase family protein [Chloroflexia bacterium]
MQILAFSLDNMYSALSALKAKSVTVFLDACFSGKSRNDKMLIAGARSVIIKTESSAFSAKNMAVLSASSNEEYSAAYPEKHHGIFTYYLLKELHENAYSLGSISVNSFTKT